MHAELGWSGEIEPGQWRKFTLRLEEEDLRRLVGPEIRAEITTGEAYQLLELEGERLVLAKLVTRYGYDPTDGRQKVAALQEQIRALIRKLADRPSDDQGPA